MVDSFLPLARETPAVIRAPLDEYVGGNLLTAEEWFVEPENISI